MASNEIHVGDIGTTLQLTFKDDGSVVAVVDTDVSSMYDEVRNSVLSWETIFVSGSSKKTSENKKTYDNKKTSVNATGVI